MINTIDECDKELLRIDSEFSRLKIEREHVLKVRTFLETQPTSSISRWKPLTQRILDVLTANPGINAMAIGAIIDDPSTTTRQISFTLANLRKDGRVENRGSRGGRGQTAQWFIKEKP